MSSETNFVTGLVAVLVENEVITAKEAQALIQDFGNQSSASFDEFVLSEGLISKEDLLLAVSRYYQVPAVDVRGYFFDIGLVKSFPKDFLIRYGIIPMETEQNIMTVIAYCPDLPGLDSKIEEYESYVIEYRVGLWRDIIDVIDECFDEPILTEQDMCGEEAEELIEEDELDQIPDESI